MTTVRIIGDVIGLLGFGAAALLCATTRLADRSAPIAKWLTVLVFSIYVFVTASDVASDFGLTNALHPFEDYIEVLVPVGILGIMLAKRASERLADIAQARRALQRSHGLMLDIVDGAPAGILFLDGGGKVAFANEVAKRTLGLEEDGALLRVAAPAWVLSWGGEVQEPGELAALVRPEPYSGEQVELQRPGGAVVPLRVSGRPFSVRSGRLGGAVVTFETV